MTDQPQLVQVRKASDLHQIHPISRETLDRLTLFVELFRKWSKAINLVAPSTLPDIWERHVADSLQIAALRPGPIRWLDLGSGGGFPGIVTAILLLETPGGRIDLVESNQKKAAFLNRALAETGAPGKVHTIRAEKAFAAIGPVEAVSARALADLESLLELSEPWITTGATAYFHKGRDYQREVDNARRSWSFDLVEHPSRVDADSVILQIDTLAPRHPGKQS